MIRKKIKFCFLYELIVKYFIYTDVHKKTIEILPSSKFLFKVLEIEVKPNTPLITWSHFKKCGTQQNQTVSLIMVLDHKVTQLIKIQL